MIKITNNKETKIVTIGAYNSFYKPLGFDIVEDKKQVSTKSDNKKVEDVVDSKEPHIKVVADDKKSEKKSGTENVVEKKNEKRK